MQWRSTTFQERQGSPEESYGPDSSKVLRRVIVRDSLAARRQAAADFLGYAQVVTGVVNGRPARWISRTIPHLYPVPQQGPQFSLRGELAPGAPGAYASSMACTRVLRTEGKGFGANEQIANVGRYPLVELSLQYEATAFDIREDTAVRAVAPAPVTVFGVTFRPTGSPLADPDNNNSKPDEGDALRRGWGGTRFVVKLPKQGGRVLPLRTGCLRYESDAQPTLEPLPLSETWLDITYTWMWVPLNGYPQQAADTYQNCVNSELFDGYAPGTLLYLTGEPVPIIGPLGDRLVNVVYHFRYIPRVRRVTSGDMTAGLPLGHNAIPRVRGGVFDYELANASGRAGDAINRPYQAKNFADLFRPTQP